VQRARRHRLGGHDRAHEKGSWSRCRFVAQNEDGVVWEDEWRKTADLIDLDKIKEQRGESTAAEPQAELQPSIGDDGRPAALEPVPTEATRPVAGTDDPLKEPTRPSRERKPPDFFGDYAMPALGSLRDVGPPSQSSTRRAHASPARLLPSPPRTADSGSPSDSSPTTTSRRAARRRC
jgi:hypothetical protein